MLRLVESYDDSSLATVEGRSLPHRCTVEDDDGRRWFITDSVDSVHPQSWIKAHTAGAVGLVVPQGSGFLVMTAPYFMEQRTESMGLYRVQMHDWAQEEHFPVHSVHDSGMEREPSGGFVHLHLHSEFSSWDGHSTVEEIATTVKGLGQTAAAITDHGYCAVHPYQAKEFAKHGIKPIFGLEAYFVDDRFSRDPEEHYHHLILLAQTQQGLKNLWAMSTESFRDGFYSKPRLDWEVLERLGEGIICSTGCLSGPLAVPLLADDQSTAQARLSRLSAIFGDRLYVEIHTNTLPEQHKVNEGLVRLAREQQVGLVAVVDSHFPTAEQADEHKHWMLCATKSEVTDDAEIFGFNPESWILSEAEVRAALSYLDPQAVDEAVHNTVRIAESCHAEIKMSAEPPVFSKASAEHPDPVRHDEDRLMDLCLEAWERKTSIGKRESQDVYMARFEREMRLLIQKGFCGYFLMVADYCLAAKEGRIDGLADGVLTGRPILVGPGRGSGGGSLVAFLCGITGVDPVEADLLFERFMTEGRTALPDFDVDFPASKKKHLLAYVTQRWGAEYVAIVGSHLRLKNRGIVKDLGKAMSDSLPESSYMDLQAVSKIIEEAEAGTAGLGLSWEELWAQEEDRLEPYLQKYPALFEMAGKLVGRLKTYGKHAAGVVISTDEALTAALPLRGGEDGRMVTQFEKDALEELGMVKFDLLTIRTLDTIQLCVDLIHDQRGTQVDVESWVEEYDDPMVWDEISAAHTLGIFQIETTPGTALTKKMQPRSVAELADMITLVRPGPTRSGLTAIYLRRRNGEEEVSFPDPRLEQVLAKTFGTLLYQEDIMQTCMVLAGYDSVEADGVRKILGKKQVEKVAAAGEKFVQGCVENGMDAMAAGALWAQMAEFAKYSFNRAHAFAYAIIGYWCAWLKFHYPVQFLTAALTTVKPERIPDFITEARRMGYAVLPPDINESGVGFKCSPLEVRYGLDALSGIGVPTVQEIVAHQPFTSYDDFYTRVVEPKGSKTNMGHVATLARIGAFDALEPNRRGLEAKIYGKKTGEDAKCRFRDDTIQITARPQNLKDPEKPGQALPCFFDWSSEPPKLGRTGKPVKNQPALPMKCTKACRNYDPIDALDISTVEPYTAQDIRKIEHELLKVYLSSTPFDDLDPEERAICKEQAETMLNGGPVGIYLTAGMVTRVKPYKDRNGNAMGFLDVETEVGVLSMAALSDLWGQSHHMFTSGTLALAEIRKNSENKYRLISFLPVA